MHTPHLLDVEVAQVPRRHTLAGELSSARAQEALADLADLPLVRYAHTHLLSRAWSLRESLAAYDAVYIALAEALEAPPLTTDRKLARSHGHEARVEAIS